MEHNWFRVAGWCGLSFTGDLLSLSLAGELLLPKISLHLGTALICTISVGKQLPMFANFRFSLFRFQVLHSALNHLGRVFHCLALVPAPSCLQHASGLSILVL